MASIARHVRMISLENNGRTSRITPNNNRKGSVACRIEGPAKARPRQPTNSNHSGTFIAQERKSHHHSSMSQNAIHYHLFRNFCVSTTGDHSLIKCIHSFTHCLHHHRLHHLSKCVSSCQQSANEGVCWSYYYYKVAGLLGMISHEVSRTDVLLC